MTGLDWFLIFAAVVIISIQTHRGSKDFDVILYEMLSVVISSFLATKWYPWLADTSRINPDYVFLFIFIILGIILLIVADALARQTEFNWPPFDSMLSFLFGFVSAWSILYALLRAASLGKLLFISQQTIDQSPIASEILNFKILHSLLNFLHSIGS